MIRYLFTFLLIFFAVFSRLLPHPPNVAPITAIALFSSVYLDKKYAFIIPVAAMLISDYFIGFHENIIFVYGSFIIISIIGVWLRRHRSIMTTLGASVAGSIIFFMVTNFGVWIMPDSMYQTDLSGLLNCYVAAIPFFRNTLIGDLFYVNAIFGLYELMKKIFPSILLEESQA